MIAAVKRGLTLLLTGCLLLAAAPAADAAAHRQTNTTLLGEYGWFADQPCQDHFTTAGGPLRGVADITPAAGSTLQADDGSVLDVQVVQTPDGDVVWGVAPRQPCTQTQPWQSESVRVGLTYQASMYTITAPSTGPVGSIAGYRPTRHPSLASAQHALGRAHVHRARSGCKAIWPKLGLTIWFVTYGGGDQCDDGFAQSATVRGPRLDDWVVKVGSRAAVGTRVTADYLDNLGVLASVKDIKAGWVALARLWLPYGEAGYYPSVAAHRGPGGYINRLDIWIGQAGD